jgi:organic radical activating enzyme
MKLEDLGCHLVEITGGEPLAQKNVFPFISTLCNRNYEVLIETGNFVSTEEVDSRAYIPLPWAADDHQTANARAVARVGGAVVLSQLSTDGRGLARIINRLSERRQEVTALGQNAARLARPDAARDIWQAMLDLHGVHHAVA